MKGNKVVLKTEGGGKDDELTEKIAKGVYDGIGKVISCIANTIILAIIIGIIGIVALNWYSDWSYEKCILDENCKIYTDNYYQSCFPLRNLDCNILVENQTGYYSSFSICGYQEANAYFEQIKPFIESELNLKVIGIKCW